MVVEKGIVFRVNNNDNKRFILFEHKSFYNGIYIKRIYTYIQVKQLMDIIT